MLRTITLFVLLSLFTTVAVPAQTSKIDKLRKAANESLNKGDRSVEISLLSGIRTKGRITTVEQESFTAIIEQTSVAEAFKFTEVDSIKRPRKGLSTGAIIGIVGAAVGGAILAGVLLKRCRNELGCGAGR